MSNPLAINEILRKVIEHLDIQDLAMVSSVNRTWRLEARKKLFQNRRHIIYSFFKPYLNDLRNKRYDLIKGDLLAIIPLQEFNRLGAFRYAFSIDIKKELLEIRKQLQKKHRRAKKLYEKLEDEAIEKNNLALSYSLFSKEYRQKKAESNEACRKYRRVHKQQCELYRELINFEYFLVRFEYFLVFGILTDQEIDNIIDKLNDFDEREEERRWLDQVDPIPEYWDDEDPDMV